MSVIEEAVYSVVRKHNQSERLAQAILAWFNELSSGNETLEDMEVVKRRIELLMEKCVVPTEESPLFE